MSMAKKASKKPTVASLLKEIQGLKQQVEELQQIKSPQVHIQSPEDGDTVLRDFTAEGSVRPKTHQVKLTLVCMQTGESSTPTIATVNPTTGKWTAGPFRKADNNFLSPGSGGHLSANSYTPQGIFADNDNVIALTIQ
jgi:hypothetical protein